MKKFVSFFMNVAQPPWALVLDSWVLGLMVVVALVGVVLIVRAGILFSLGLEER